MKLSARNALAGTVVAIVRGATTAHVKIDVGDGVVVTAAVTNEAVDALKLQIGQAATAISMATMATFGRPNTSDVVKLASASGGLIRRPLLYQMAVDWTMKLIDRVAMIGGMRKSLIRP